MITRLERAAFARVLTRECPAATAADADELIRLAVRHGRIAERQCNGHQTPTGDWDRAAAERDERAEERTEAAIRAVCERIGCRPVFSGDPRGATVKLAVPSGYSDSWGGEGICVPQ